MQKSSVARQVENAKKQLDTWPDWMRKAGRFEGLSMSDAVRQLWACSPHKRTDASG